MIRVAFRADGSGRIGTGHLRRCEALAQAVLRLGGAVLFVSRELDDLHSARAPLVGPCAWLPAPVPAPEESAPWSLQDGWADDASRTLAILEAFRPDWVLVDHYGLDARWHERVREAGHRLAAIDDLADRPLAVDVLVDHNLAVDHRAKYLGRVGTSTRILGGPRYALLSARYADAQPYVWHPTVRSIGIYLGGGDAADVTALALSVCRQAAGFRGPIELVSHSRSAHHASRLALAARSPGTTVLSDQPDLCDFFARHDLQIGAGGGASWERCRLGAPTIAISIAANQDAVLPQLESLGAVVRLQAGPGLSDRLADAVRALLHDPDRRQALGKASRALVDGQGAARVAAVLALAHRPSLVLRPVTIGDAELLLDWANDPEVRAHSFSSARIEPQAHRRWLAARIGRQDCRMWVAQGPGGLPVGQVRLEQRGSTWELGYSIDAAFRRLGLAVPLLRLALDALAGLTGQAHVTARVKPGNPASSKAFRTLGFEQATEQGPAGPHHCFTTIWPASRAGSGDNPVAAPQCPP